MYRPALVSSVARSDRPASMPLEALRVCMDAQAMKAVLNDEWSYLHARGERLVDCQLVRLYPRGGEDFLLEYNVQLQGRGEAHTLPIFAELVGENAPQRCRQGVRHRPRHDPACADRDPG